MIPNRLTLKNFLCYRDATLDLEGVHLAVLSGDNGAGKSSILDAMTWALWGKARAGDDDLIAQGEVESEVDFEFKVGEDYFRVNRRRTRKSSGHTELNFYVRKLDGSWSNIGEPTVRAKEKQIATTIRTSYETFINSAFLLQGRADSFTVKTAGERKKVLAEILELSRYDEYEKQTKERSREAEAERLRYENELKELTDFLRMRPEFEQQKQDAEARLELERNPMRLREEQQVEFKTRKNRLESSRADLERVSKEINANRKNLEAVKEALVEARRSLNVALAVQNRREEIEESYGKLQEARKIEDSFNEKLHHLNDLNSKQTALENIIQRQKMSLQNKLESIERDLAAVRRNASTLPEIVVQREQTLSELQNAANARKEVEKLRSESAGVQGEAKQAELEVKRLSGELPKIHAKANNVPQEGDRCDQCGTKLEKDAREHTIQEYRKQYKEVQDLKQAEEAKHNKLKERLKELNEQVKLLESQAKPYDELNVKKARLDKEIETAQESERQVSRLELEKEENTRKLKAQDFALQEQQSLQELKQVIATLDYDREAHRQASEQRNQYARYEGEYQRLEMAVTTIARENRNQERYTTEEENYRNEIARKENEKKRLEAEIQDLPELIQKLTALEKEIKESRDRQSLLEKQKLQAEAKLSECDAKAKKEIEIEKAFQRAAEERKIYTELAEAFGKKGIQAMIIDAALPEIEEESNRLLAEMTDGRMSVRFDTQREGRRGEAIETLELYISDEYGARPYELFSGGEAFRVNFAVRIALSKMLARRSGAQLRSLFIDEGFGSQDGQGRERIVDAIRGIEKDFDRIIVITHIQELKDVFPTRIDVVKTPGGSQITLV
ncbi:MAG: SMC family ATPase [Chloroflexi bacterium]|uniref:Nuclease SbcCD subunit C n=1 Tax=Candidatus Chlorohelix allophototropha TaxID=3003348 RepID=A0A8T7LZN6_9CHLR|nr:SMC family ATPase [Chloroflexota bacterium]WJW66762.1 SMC family ATPase [Chloroflexota bacterium L227-S17]